MSQIVHTFHKSNEWGESVKMEPFWEAAFREAWPGFVSMCCNRKKNRANAVGIDRLVMLDNGRALRVDCKARDKDFGDILLEYVSDDTRPSGMAPGWIEKDLEIDFLAYGVLPASQVYLFPWEQLRRAWRLHKKEWLAAADAGVKGFEKKHAKNCGFGGHEYNTLFVCVPRNVVANACREAIRIPVERRITDEVMAQLSLVFNKAS